jgi:hypothetical protein
MKACAVPADYYDYLSEQKGDYPQPMCWRDKVKEMNNEGRTIPSVQQEPFRGVYNREGETEMGSPDNFARESSTG